MRIPLNKATIAALLPQSSLHFKRRGFFSSLNIELSQAIQLLKHVTSFGFKKAYNLKKKGQTFLHLCIYEKDQPKGLFINDAAIVHAYNLSNPSPFESSMPSFGRLHLADVIYEQP